MDWLGIRFEGWLTLVAIVLGPILALAIQRWLDDRRERRRPQIRVFSELMATRAAKLGTRHVEALNAIEIEFGTGHARDKKVVDKWREYLDHLNLGIDETDKDTLRRWGEKSDELLAELLFEMSSALASVSTRSPSSAASTYLARMATWTESRPRCAGSCWQFSRASNRCGWGSSVVWPLRVQQVADAPLPEMAVQTANAPKEAETGEGTPDA